MSRGAVLGDGTGMRGIIVMLLAAGILVTATLPPVLAQIGVENDGPSFIDISITEDSDMKMVNIRVRDLNGWTNIFCVNVTVYDEEGGIISQVNYTQYPSLDSDTLIIQWDQVVGDYLNTEASTWEAAPVWPWNPENTEIPIGLNLTFAYEKFAGDSISIVCMDKGSVPLTAEYHGPFSAEFTPAPSFEDVTVPISISTIVALLGALFMTYRRFKNNQLARAVEAREAGEE